MAIDNILDICQISAERQQRSAKLLCEMRANIQRQLAEKMPNLLPTFDEYEETLAKEQQLFPLNEVWQAGVEAKKNSLEPQAALWEFMKGCLMQATQDGLDARRNSLFWQLSQAGWGQDVTCFTQQYRQVNSVNDIVEREFYAGYDGVDKPVVDSSKAGQSNTV